MKSLRASLVWAGVTVMALVLLLAALAAYWSVQRSLRAQFDAFLEHELMLVANLVEIDSEGLVFESELLDLADFESDDGPAYLEVVVEGDSTLYRSPNWNSQWGAEELDDEPSFWSEGDGAELRFVGLRLLPRIDLEDEEDEVEDDEEEDAVVEASTTPAVVVRLGRRDAFRAPFLADFRLAALAVTLPALLLMALVISLLARRGLRRLDRLALEIADLRIDGSASPLATAELPVELLPIVQRLNALVERIAAFVARERGLSADIAHELRTPISALRTNFEVTLQRERDSAAYQASLRTALTILRRSESMIHRLLELQRMETPNGGVERQAFELSELVREQWALFASQAEAKQLRVVTLLAPSLSVQSDPTLWRLIAANLVENAIEYADRGGTLRIELAGGNRAIRFEVRNSGSNVANEAVPLLLERFARGDAARSSAGTHVGLGLTLVRQACALLNLQLTIDARVGGDFVVCVEESAGA